MIPIKKRSLPPYGDYDKDGAPNWSDCDPRNPNEQGIFKRAVGVITRDKYGQSAEEYAEEKAKLAELKSRAEAAGVPVKETGIGAELKEQLVALAQAGSPDSGAEKLQQALYGGETQTRYPVQRQQTRPAYPTPSPEPSYYPPPEDEYTYKSYYYRKPGYIYLPSVKKPVKHRPKRIRPVNPFRRAAQMYAHAGLRASPIKIRCPYCGLTNYSYTCTRCGASLR